MLAAAGQRTSLFRLRDEVWGCYLRLPDQRTGQPVGGDRPDRRARCPGGWRPPCSVADRVCALIPRYSGVRHVDPRAPGEPAADRRTRDPAPALLGDPAGATLAPASGRDATARVDLGPRSRMPVDP